MFTRPARRFVWQVVVSAPRSDRRIEDVPLRVEVLGREEVEEKMLMTPGDISMMLDGFDAELTLMNRSRDGRARRCVGARRRFREHSGGARR